MDAEADLLAILKALASDKRLQVLAWLKDPRAHFPPQRDGDLVSDGVCGLLIAQKLGLSQPTVHGHMKLLVQAGLVRETRIRQWTFYRRDEGALAAATARLAECL
ncbi:MAG: helix-turn-helix transcriptional regulator [Tistlia sp.]|uniref:ArsR/SmtB family transcription factor n=1 Tax=Tistlia sp. TaxID=3057121 RepID=UPI0034A3BC74